MTLLTWQWLAENAGIRILTGESERISPGMRLLCDVTQEGHDLVAQYLSVQRLELRSSWNDGIGSIMLSRHVLNELCIYRWITKHEGGGVLEMEDGALYSLTAEERLTIKHEEMPAMADNRIKTLWRIDSELRGKGDRCTHQISGRTL